MDLQFLNIFFFILYLLIVYSLFIYLINLGYTTYLLCTVLGYITLF